MPAGHPGSAAGHTALGFRDSQAWMQEMGLHLRKLGGTYVGLGAPGVEVGREEPGKEAPTEERGMERRRGHQLLPRDPDSSTQEAHVKAADLSPGVLLPGDPCSLV